jgi:hypothetical protein
VLVYITNKSPVHPEGRRLPAILELNEPFASHAAAAAWYRANGQRVPNSCIVPGNDPVPMDLTDPKLTCTKEEFPDSKAWSQEKYVPRAKRCEQCFSCRVVHLKLDGPPIVDDEFWDLHLKGGLPSERMQNSGHPITQRFYDALLTHAGIQVT